MELVGLAVLSVVGGVIWINWQTFQKRFIHDYIIEAALVELSRPDGRLTKPIIGAAVSELSKDDAELSKSIAGLVERLRKAEVGTINSGSFFLTPQNQAYTLYIYIPAGHKGKLFYRLKNNLSNDAYVDVIRPDGSNEKLEESTASINLEAFAKGGPGGLAEQGIEGIVESLGTLKDLRAVTFQLAGPGSSGSEDVPSKLSGIEVSYVSYVLPAIRMEN